MPFDAENIDRFEQLFRAHWERVYGVIFRLVGDRNEAQALAGEVFFRLYTQAQEDRSIENPPGWLYRAAVNAALNELRAERRRQRYEDAAGLAMLLENGRPGEPEPETIRSEERQLVRQVLAAMRPRSARLLVLRHSGLSYAEVAESVGIAPASVGTLLARAEREFEQCFRDLTAEPKPELPLQGD